MTTRKTILYSLILSLLIAPSIFSQKKDSTAKKVIFLGPELGGTLAMNTVDYHVENVKRSIGFNITAGAVFAYKFEGDNALLGGLHYYSLAYRDENEYVSVNNQQANISNKIITKGTFSYLGISCMLRASVVLIGFQIGLPLDGSSTIELGSSTGRSGTSETNQIGAITVSSTDKMKVLFEPRIGVEFPIVTHVRGDFVMGFTFGYPVSTMSESPYTLPNMTDNFRLPNMKIHASYRFSLGRDAKE